MERTNERISEILDVGELFVPVMNQKSAGKNPQDQKAEIREEWFCRERSQHWI